jgi:hypothetical protein
LDRDSLVLTFVLESTVILALVAVYIQSYTERSGLVVTTVTTYSEKHKEVLSLAKDVEKGVGLVRNLTFTSEVRFELINTSWALEQWAPKEEEPTSIPPEMLFREVVYKATFLLPLNFSIVSGERGFVGMFLAATAGTTIYINTDYFDPKSPGSRNVLAHELTHVLQFLHFPNIFAGEETTDSMLAKQALIEGDAGLTQRLYCITTKLCTPSPSTQIDLGNPYIALITFPYVYGERFVFYLYNYSGWSLVNKAYEKPPTATSMAMHPEKYLQYLFTGDLGFEEPVVKCEACGDRVYSDRLGEYYTLLVLAQRIGVENATKVVEQWRGDKLVLFKSENTTHVTWVLCWNTTWASEKASEEFYTSLVQSLKRIGTAKLSESGFEAQVVIVQNSQKLYAKIVYSSTWVFINSTLTTQKQLTRD